MSRQHFTVGIDIDPLVLCLLQKLGQILQIMTGNHDKRSLLDIGLHLYRGWRTEGVGIGTVQKLHTFKVYFAKFHDQFNPFLGGMFFIYFTKSFVKPFCHTFIFISEIHGVVGVGRHTLQSEKQGGAEGYFIIAAIPKCHDRCLFVTEFFAFLYDTVCKFTDRFIVKIDIG